MMVVSKKCKICAALDQNNVSISGEYFGKLIPDLIMKICGIELDMRKANGVLICQSCIIQLVLTDVVIEKLRKAVYRLKKNERNTKLKTPSKDSSGLQTKVGLNSTKNGEQQQKKSNVSDSQSYIEEQKNTKTPSKVGRKSIVFDEKKMGPLEGNNLKDNVPNTLNSVKFQKFFDNDMTTTKAAKRVLTQLTDTADPSLVKRKKKISASLCEETPMDLTVDEQDGNESKTVDGVKEIKVKVMNCIICGKMFNSKGSLRVHIETVHMGERLKACPHCSSEFRSQQKYESHIFSEKCKNNNHACQYPKCNKRFKTVHKMELHMQEKHLSKSESGSE